MSFSETSLVLHDARRMLSALLERLEPLGGRADSRAVAWSLSGIRQLLAEGVEPLRLSDCLILAGVIAYLLESTMRREEGVGPLPSELEEAHRETLAFMERCAWAAAAGPAQQTADRRVDRALQYLSTHYRRVDLSIHDVARHVSLSRHYFSRLLVQCTGRGFLLHLHELRIREARRLLLVTMMSVKEVAASVGYGDAAQFCRQFKRMCKTSPGMFRRAARSTNRPAFRSVKPRKVLTRSCNE